MAKVISQLPSGGSVPKHNNLLGLNEGDYIHLTQFEKAKLDGIQSGAEVNVNADWNAVSGDARILNKPASFPPSTHTHAISEVINLQNELNSKENISNKVNTISGNSSTEYPTEKAVVDYVSSQIGADFAKVVYFDNVTPNVASIFDLNNPPLVNDPSLKEDVANLYIGTDASTWVYITSPAGYVTKTVTSSGSNFYITGTSTDAGSIKTGSITKKGQIVIDSGVIDDSGLTLKKTESSILKTDSLGKVVKATNLQDVEYAPIVHTHTVSQITDFAHTHPISEVSGLQGVLDVKKNKVLAITTEPAITKTLAVTDECIVFTNANPVTFTIPTNASVPMPIGTEVQYTQQGDGVVTVGGAGITFVTNLALAMVKGETRKLTKIGTDTWSVEGVEVTLTSSQTFSSGIKTFLNGVFGLRNVANTFTSFFSNSATASRTWTFPDKNGTVAMTSDLPTNTVATGNQNRMLKYINAGGTQAGNSRIVDDGVYIGIDTVNPPTKDITLGSQSNKNIGVEDSDLLTKGRDLILGAGRTVNFTFNNAFNITTSPAAAYGMCSTPSGNMYIVGDNANVYKQTGGSGTWVTIPTGIGSTSLRAICSDANNNLYVAAKNGSIYKQTNETGAWVNLNQTARQWVGMCVASGDVYASVSNGDVYKQTGGIGDFIALNQITRAWGRMTVSASGLDVYILASGEIYKQINKTGNFIFHANTTSNGIIIDSANNLYVQDGTDIVVQNNLTGSFISTGSNIKDGYGSVWGMAQHINGSIYAGIWNEVMYIKQPSGTGIPDLDGGTYKAKAGTGKGTGKSRVEFYTGQKTVSGTDMQIETLREYIDENGYHVYTSMPVYADNAAAIAGGLPIGCEYRTATGVKMIVY